MGVVEEPVDDLCIALPAVVLGWPIVALVAAAVHLRLNSPVPFRQVRPGYQGRPFELLKFRTVLDQVGEDGLPLPDEVRLTKLGRFLRRTSLDELPELWTSSRAR